MGLPCGGLIYLVLTCSCLLLCLQTGHADWGEWGAWTPCSATCGSGTQTRIRHYEFGPDETGTQNANETDIYSCYSGKVCKPVNGGWSGYDSWSNCSRRCGSGWHQRWRKCDNPKPQYGGKVCNGSAVQNGKCNLPACPALYDGEVTTLCREGYVICADGKQCIPERRRCDNYYDCLDGSDESACIQGEPVVIVYLNSGMTHQSCTLAFPIISTWVAIFLSLRR